jgi:uncharacterized protein
MTEAFHIAVFCRPLVVGQVKTRLIPALGAAGATDAYAQMVRRTLGVVRNACQRSDGTASLWVAGDCDHPSVVGWCDAFGFSAVAQADGDLGARMADCLQRTCTAHQRTLLIGTDCPVFAPAHLEFAAARLSADCPWVFVPSNDGGYVLIGVHAANAANVSAYQAPFCDVEWSSERVMAQTRDALNATHMSFAELPELWDVDDIDDFDRAVRLGLLARPYA